MTALGQGVYSITEAARLTQLRRGRVSEWFRGRETPSRTFKPVFRSDYPILDGQHALSFLDLVELNIAGKLRDAGISLQSIRRNYQRLRDDFGDHPFCTREVYVGDKQIFTRGLDDAEGRLVIEAISRQAYFDAVILPFLERIDYDETSHRAIRWHIADHVVVDPQFRFGKPTVVGTGMSTDVLHHSFYANGGSAAAVATWFGVEESDVMAAVAFEDSLAA